MKWSSSSPCREGNHKDDLWVIVSAAKGGTVLAARASLEIGYYCDLCVGIGHRPDGKWPPAREYNPPYRCDVFMAIANAQNWQEYAREHGGPVRCVVLTRNPLTRFKSLYQYIYDGSEYDLVDPSKELQKIHKKNITQAVYHMFKTIGNQTFIDSHQHLMLSLQRPDCTQIRFEDFTSNFDETMSKWLENWEIMNPKIQQNLLKRLARYDLNRQTATELAKEHHISGRSLTKEEVQNIENAIRSYPDIMQLLNHQSRDLSYE